MGARQKLLNDLKPSLAMWLKDGYATDSPLQLDKAAVLKVVDDTAGRLATLARGSQLTALRR